MQVVSISLCRRITTVTKSLNKYLEADIIANILCTRVFSVDQTHSDLLAKERATMLVLRARQSAASQLSFLSKPNYKVYVKVSDFNKHFVEGLIQVKITDMNEAPIIGRDPSLSFALPLDNVRYIEEDASKVLQLETQYLFLTQISRKVIYLVLNSRAMILHFQLINVQDNSKLFLISILK